MLGISTCTGVFADTITLSTTAPASDSCSIVIDGTTYYFQTTDTNYAGMTTIKNEVTTDGVTADNADFTVNGSYYKLVMPSRSSDNTGITGMYLQGYGSNDPGSVKEVPSSIQTVDIIGSNFYNNSSNNNGGVIYNVGSRDQSVQNSRFYQNSSYFGGAIYYAPAGNTTISGSTFVGNTANMAGGAIAYVTPGTASELTISNTTFKNNNAQQGGALYIKSDSEINLTNTVFIGNSASYNSGAIYITAPDDGSSVDTILNIANSQFGDNNNNDSDSIYIDKKSTVNFTGENKVYCLIMTLK